MEVYIDNMLVKSLREEEHLEPLKETFDVLEKYQLRLNPTKCNFAILAGKFLGHLVTQRRIVANPSQIKALLSMPSPKCKKDVQRMN